jgi:transcriptional regulator with XRE-family HTH domain
MNENAVDPFPARLKRARDLRKLSQSELAERARIPASSISHFEAGARKPSFDSLRRLATALEVTTDYLLGRVEDVASAGAEGDQLFRDLQNLSEHDRETMKVVIESLAQRNAKAKSEKDE